MRGLNALSVRVRAALAIAILAMVVSALGACSPAASRFRPELDASSPGVYGVEPAVTAIPAEMTVDMTEILVREIQPLWTLTYSGNIDVAMSPRGDRIAVTAPEGRGIGCAVFDAHGEQLWADVFFNYHKVTTRFLSGAGHVGVWVHNRDVEGFYRLYDPEGEPLLTQDVRGSVTAGLSDDSTRLVLVEHGQRRLQVFDVASGDLLVTHTISRGSAVSFVPSTQILMIEGDSELRLIDEAGRVLRRFPLPRELRRSVVPSPDGQSTALTTGLGENVLHVYDRNGAEVWSHLLLPGGTNDLMYSPGGDRLLAFNVGRRGGLGVFDASTGHMLWRAAFGSDPGAQTIAWKRLAFCRDNRHIVGHLTVRDADVDTLTERSVLMLISSAGEFLSKATLGYNVEVALSLRGESMAVIRGTPDGRSYIMDTVEFYDLSWLQRPTEDIDGN